MGYYKKYFEHLPDSRSIWRFRLYVLSLCPEVFSSVLKDELSRVFTTKHYYDLISGAEYYKYTAKSIYYIF